MKHSISSIFAVNVFEGDVADIESEFDFTSKIRHQSLLKLTNYRSTQMQMFESANVNTSKMYNYL